MTKIICSECGKEKENHARGICATCYQRILRKDIKENRPEKHQEILKREAAKDKKRWNGERREKNNKQRLERYFKNYDIELEKRRIYREENKTKIYAQQKEYVQKNIERIRARNREYNKRRDKVKEFARLAKWESEQPIEKLREIWVRQSQKRRNIEKGLPYTLTVKEWDEIKESFGNKCAYCGGEKKLSQDHVIPLSRGGGYTKDNIVPACKSCNSKKGDRTADEYFEYLKSHS